MFTEAHWQETDERRPIILVGQGIIKYDAKRLKKIWDIKLHETDMVDLLEPRHLVEEAGIVAAEDRKGIKDLMKGFGLVPIEDWWLHNAGNDAVLTLVITLLAALNNKLHPDESQAGGFSTSMIQGRTISDILKAALPTIKANSPPDWDVIEFCTRCDQDGHMIDSCRALLRKCPFCGGDHQSVKCLKALGESKDEVDEVETEVDTK